MLDAQKLEYIALKEKSATAFRKIATALEHPNVTQEQYKDLAAASEDLTRMIRGLARLQKLLEND